MVKIVLGSLFGDEGKGQEVYRLATENTKRKLIVRFSGGAQAGHRVVTENGVEHVHSLYGSGTLAGYNTYLGDKVFVDPISLVKEYEVLKTKMSKVPQIIISFGCRVVTPYDIYSGLEDKKITSDGTCGCGIYPTFKRYKYNRGHSNIGFLIKNADYKNGAVIGEELDHYREYYNGLGINEKDRELFIKSCEFIYNNPDKFKINKDSFGFFSRNYSEIIYEGSQGLLLDMDNGFMPNCTPSRTGLNGINPDNLKDAEVYLVFRSYLTRHGNGYIPKYRKILEDTYNNLEEPTNLDSGPQGIFRRGVFDIDLLKRAVDRHHLDNYANMYNCKFNLVMTRANAMSFKDVPYILNGELHYCWKNDLMRIIEKEINKYILVFNAITYE